MRVLVIGGSGFIGSNVLDYLSDNHVVCGTYYENPNVRVPGCSYRQLNVTDSAAVDHIVAHTIPETVVMVCGSQDIALCAGSNGLQKEAERARHVHVHGSRNVTEACLRYGCRLAYVSTDCVFDGSKTFFSESDECAPYNAYGRVKREAEQIIEDSALSHTIIRVSLTFGWRRHCTQFHNFALRVLDRLSQDEGVADAATNLFNTPIEVTAAASAIARIALTREQGVFHVASSDRISRYDFARSVAEAFGYPSTRVLPFEDVTGLRQPNSCLSVERAQAILGEQFEGYAQGLHRMREEWVTP